jgi:acetylornithine/N-succinyldiaminopimelate aminotransferase
MLEQGKKTAGLLWSRLHELKETFPTLIESIRGRGMMIGIRTNLSPEALQSLQKNLMEDGILVNITAGTVMRLLPPLTLTEEEIDTLMKALNKHLQARMQ